MKALRRYIGIFALSALLGFSAEANQDRVFPWLQPLGSDRAASIWSWDPKGDPQEIKYPGCDAIRLERDIVANRGKGQYASRGLRTFLDRCEKETVFDTPRALLMMARDDNLIFDFKSHRRIKEIALYDRHGFKVRALLALRPGTQKYPLVIAKCGIHCNLGGAWTVLSLMYLFDEAPFHVLMLGSTTGSDWQKDNKTFALGGADEGQQILDLARYMMDESKNRHRFSRVHIVSGSLGGNAGLYSALYSEHNPREDGSRYITSVFAGCPVVDLETSVRNLYRPNVVGQLLARRAWKQFTEMARYVPLIRLLIPNGQDVPKVEYMPQMVERLTYEYYRKYLSGDMDAPVDAAPVNRESDVWKYNRFQNYAHLVRKTPVWSWASQDDPIVRPEQNIRVLESVYGKMESSRYQTIVTRYGSHCTYQGAYKWSVVSSAIRGFLLANSPELLERRHTVRVPLKFLDRKPAVNGGTGRLVWARWNVDNGWNYAQLQLRYERFGCGAGVCDTKRYYNVPLSLFRIAKAEFPKVGTEAQGIARWLNANVRLAGATRGQLKEWEVPTHAEWLAY